MKGELELKAKVITDLMEKGATEITIEGTNIKVTRREYLKMISAPSQVVNVKVDASSHFSAEINSKLDGALDYLKSKYIEKRELSELEDKINILKQELSKSNPNKSKLKSILKWSLDKGLDIFVKLAPPVIEKISRLI